MRAKEKKRGFFRTALRAVGIVVLAVVVAAVGLVGYLAVTEYRPSAVETLEVAGTAGKTLADGGTFRILTWNIGYGALGDNADFFMDGGTMVRTADEARIRQNLEHIYAQIEAMQPDVVFLQEADADAARSCHIDETAWMRTKLAGFASVFAENFKVAFLPYPIPPIGKVDAGIATYSAFPISTAERVQLPVPFSWPVSMVNLKRCLLVSRIPIEDSGRELVLVNLHLEAYDDGEGKAAQTAMLADLLEQEAEKGNYVIAGGDFNQTFSDAGGAYPVQAGNWVSPELEVGRFAEGWQFLMDDSVPTCRSLYKPYADADKNSFQYYVLDGFIVSAGIAVEIYRTEDCGFTASDHNPVWMQCTLAQEE